MPPGTHIFCGDSRRRRPKSRGSIEMPQGARDSVWSREGTSQPRPATGRTGRFYDSPLIDNGPERSAPSLADGAHRGGDGVDVHGHRHEGKVLVVVAGGDRGLHGALGDVVDRRLASSVRVPSSTTTSSRSSIEATRLISS